MLVFKYLDVPGGARGGVGAPQRARDASRTPHADCCVPARARPTRFIHNCSLCKTLASLSCSHATREDGCTGGSDRGCQRIGAGRVRAQRSIPAPAWELGSTLKLQRYIDLVCFCCWLRALMVCKLSDTSLSIARTSPSDVCWGVMPRYLQNWDLKLNSA